MHHVLDLFSGIGGFSRGLEATGGFETVGFCEIDQSCHSVLTRHWPGIPIYRDIQELTVERLHAERIIPSVLCGGFPCQDISVAKAQAKGLDGERSGLWREYARLIHTLRPEWAIIENVPALLGRGLTRILQDLFKSGYDAEWSCIRAHDILAPHIRDRIWIVAYPISAGPSVGQSEFQVARKKQPPIERAGDTSCPRLVRLEHHLRATQDEGHWRDGVVERGRLVKPGVRLLADGIPNRVQRIKQLGNSVVPQIVTAIGKSILDFEEEAS